MAKFCGGFKFDSSLKLIDGILCLSEAVAVDKSKAVTGCGQMWDGDEFKIVKVDGYRPCVTLKRNGNDVKFMAGNCGVGLDSTFFNKVGNVVSVADGYTLRVEYTPVEAAVTVLDEKSNAIDPRETGEGYNVYTLKNLDGKYSVTVEEDGYTGKSQTIDNDRNQVIKVDLEEVPATPILTDIEEFKEIHKIKKSATEYTDYYGFSWCEDKPQTKVVKDLVVGNNYKVIYDNQEYTLTCKDYNSPYKFLGEIADSAVAYYGAYYSGDQVVTNASFTNYPFFVCSVPMSDIPNGYGQWYVQTTGEHSIAIYDA